MPRADVIFRIPPQKKPKVLISNIPTSLTEKFSQLLKSGPEGKSFVKWNPIS